MTGRYVPRSCARLRERGLTLIELLAAMAIFLGLAGMVLQVLGGGLDLWSTGEKTRDSSERAAFLLDRMAQELRHAVVTDSGFGEPRLKMLCDLTEHDLDGDHANEVRLQRFLFVRQLFEARSNSQLRSAGLMTETETVPYVGRVLEPGSSFLPTEGLVEVAWLALPDYRKGYEGRVVLWRALRSPIGGDRSLFRTVGPQGNNFGQVEMDVLAENVLHVGFEFLPFDDQQNVVDELRVWDSTRGVLEPGAGGSAFPFSRGRASLEQPDDDLFPRAVRLSIVVVPPPEETVAPLLNSDLPRSDRSFRVEVANGRVLQKLGLNLLVKIGHEWMEASCPDGRFLSVQRRGVFSTAVSQHLTGAKIQFGHLYERVVMLPVFRSNLVSRDR